jgi:hypothetical protein
MKAATLKRPIERLAYRRPEAAAALGVSETKFAEWEQRGMVPRAIVIDGCRLYDAEQLRYAWQMLKDEKTAEFDSRNPYDL